MNIVAAKYKQGFTLLEVLISMLALSIFLLSSGLMLSFGWKHWFYNNEVVKMQRDATLAQATICREIRQSTINDISVLLDRINFAGQGVRTSAESIYASGNDLIHEGPGGSFIVVREMLAEFKPTLGTNSVSVSLTLKTPDGKIVNSQSFTVYPRNKDE